MYGSYATDLCLPYSDIDLVVELPNENKQPQKSYIEKNLQKLEESLKVALFLELNFDNFNRKKILFKK